MRPNILIVTESDDAHADVVIKELDLQNICFSRLNVDKIAEEKQTRYLTRQKNDLEKESFETVWYRARTPVPNIPYSIIQAYTDLETSAFVQGLLARHKESRWINPPPALQLARIKIEQILRAQEVDLLTPETVVSNVEADILEFFKVHNSEVVAKPLQAQVIFEKDQSYVFGTRRVGINDINELTTGTPVMLQELVSTQDEVRAIVFGNQVHAFKMTKLKCKDDIKQVKDVDLMHEVYALPPKTEGKLLKLMRGYGLEFAACDFLLKPNGELVFLELNPNGQWLWLQYATGYDLLSPFVSFLCVE